MKSADKLRRQREAALRDMPVTVLLCILTSASVILHGADGGGVLQGIRIPAFDLPPKDVRWMKVQTAKIARWATECLELYGFDPTKGSTGTWNAARRKMDRLARELENVIPACSGADFWKYAVAQMAVLECCWQSVMVYKPEKRQQARYLLRTMRTLSDKYIAEESPLDWQMTEAYLAVSDYITEKEVAA